ncbi:MAG: DUF4153 domain-containing protein [Bacteroidetes bacterium]|nr:DUF4153 domain-containing protein [Bacteroidota bacterium]
MKKLSVFLQKAQGVVLRYPMVLLMSFIMTSVVIYMTEAKDRQYDDEANYIQVKLVIVSALGISLMFALKMLAQRIGKGKEILIQISGLIFLLGFYFLVLPTKNEDFSDIYVFVLVPTFILSHLLVAVAAFFRAGHSEKNFWEYNKNLFVNFFLTGIFTQVLTGGVELAIVAIQQLFNVDFGSNVYLETFFALTIFGSTFIFLLFNDEGLSSLEQETKYPVVLKFFTQFILIPLLCIYVVILYLYSAKILLAWELPRGWVSYLILAYASVGILALLLVHPLKEDEDGKSWVKIFGKVFYVALIPLLVLLFVAIFTRILQYGFTEPRYFVLLLALWLATVVLYFVLNKKANIKFIPMSLFLFGLFALIFPYFNVFSTSIRSQKHEFEKLLTENDLLENGTIKFTKYIGNTSIEISEKFNYLNKRKEKEYLKNFLPENLHAQFDNNHTTFWLNGYFNRASIDTVNGGKNHSNSSENIFVILENESGFTTNIKGYDYAVPYSWTGKQSMENHFKINNDEIKFSFVLFGARAQGFFRLTLNGDETVDVFPSIENLFENHTESKTVKVKDLAVEKDLGKYHIKIIFQSISSYGSSKTYQINAPLFLIKEKR